MTIITAVRLVLSYTACCIMWVKTPNWFGMKTREICNIVHSRDVFIC